MDSPVPGIVPIVSKECDQDCDCWDCVSCDNSNDGPTDSL